MYFFFISLRVQSHRTVVAHQKTMYEETAQLSRPAHTSETELKTRIKLEEINR
jgi:hypothetical protein